MVPAVVILSECSLAVHGPAEFAAPNHQRVVQQPALFQVLHQRRAGPVHVLALPANLAGQAAVLVPAAVEQLHEPHAALTILLASRQFRAKPPLTPLSSTPYIARISFVSFDKSVSPGTDVCIRNAISYWAIRVSISGSPRLPDGQFVQLAHAVQHGAARGGIDTRRIGQVQHGIALAAEPNALMFAGQEAAAPQPRKDRLVGLVSAPCEIMTTKHGRSSLSLPRP